MKQFETMTDTSKFIYLKLNRENKNKKMYFFGYKECVFDDIYFFLDDDYVVEVFNELKKDFKEEEIYDVFLDRLTMFDIMENISPNVSVSVSDSQEFMEHLTSGEPDNTAIFSNISSKYNYLPFGDTRSVDCYKFKDLMNNRPFVSHEHNLNEYLVQVEKEYEEKKNDPKAKFVAKTLDWHYVPAEEVMTSHGKHSTENAVYVELFVTENNGHYSKCRFFCPRKYTHFGRNGTVYIPYWIVKSNGSDEKNVIRLN